MSKVKKWSFNKVNHKEVAEINIDIKCKEDLLKDNGSISSLQESLNKSIEEYLFKSIKCYPVNQKVDLLVIIKDGLTEKEKETVEKIIHCHFCYKLKEMNIFLKEQFRQWRINLFIGILFLILCLILGEVLDKFSYVKVMKMVKESLLIIGWVALWEPVSFILFGWRIARRDKQYCKKLCNIPIEVVEKQYITQLLEVNQ